ncbi:MAG: cell filamentation protein Fic [Bacteroidetes bacterium]|nr:MAG: cell filamentation protein Fic [Bacteroidota bacterium]
MDILGVLCDEMRRRAKGGLYHQTQIKLSYNTNRMEGSLLSEDQTRYIYETNTLFLPQGEETARVDDILETVNHFACFDYMLSVATEPLCEEHIKTMHRLLKQNTSQSRLAWFSIGGYKQRANMVGGLETCPPAEVGECMREMLAEYTATEEPDFLTIVDFHYHFERIHPFQDGNGRVGRLIMFKECLRHGEIPFIIEEDHKFFYYRGLAEYPRVREYLIETCRSAQDTYRALAQHLTLPN